MNQFNSYNESHQGDMPYSWVAEAQNSQQPEVIQGHTHLGRLFCPGIRRDSRYNYSRLSTGWNAEKRQKVHDIIFIK